VALGPKINRSLKIRVVTGLLLAVCLGVGIWLAMVPIAGGDASCGSLLDRRGEIVVEMGPLEREDPSCGSARVSRGALLVVVGIGAVTVALASRYYQRRPERNERRDRGLTPPAGLVTR
jgi:ABC-type transporter Mla subunit MlaD